MDKKKLSPTVQIRETETGHTINMFDKYRNSSARTRGVVGMGLLTLCVLPLDKDSGATR